MPAEAVPTNHIAEVAKQARKKMVSELPYKNISLCIGMEDGKEIVHQISDEDVRIVSVQHSVNEKVKQSKDEEGNLLGFEPTGEYELTLKVKFVKEP
jgi:hypothetical protein